LDSIILAIPFGIIFWVAHAFFDNSFWVPEPGLKGVISSLGMATLSSLVYLLINGKLLERDGQSIGKRICRIKIIKPDGSIPALRDSFIKRNMVMAVIQGIPIIGRFLVLIDVLLIFRENRKCFHDDLAGTLVVKVPQA
jgi:uncharacterized RDD family membrane protein YckC